jgi:hypothetical protein
MRQSIARSRIAISGHIASENPLVPFDEIRRAQNSSIERTLRRVPDSGPENQCRTATERPVFVEKTSNRMTMGEKLGWVRRRGRVNCDPPKRGMNEKLGKMSIEQSAEFLGLRLADVMALVKSGLLPYQDCKYYQEILCKEKCLIFNKKDLIKIKSGRKK